MDNKLREIIKEDKQYYFGKEMKKSLYRRITQNPLYKRGEYVIVCRKLGYHKAHTGLCHQLLAIIYLRKKNILGKKLNIELGPDEFGRRLRIYHNDIVVNAGAVIGDDCEFYGNNCIGNKGSGSEPLGAPTIGNNVSFGVGANAIGRISICDHVQVSSMSLVNKDITEAGLYGGVPAQLIRSKT
ncbi:hypothetical protein [Pseudoflavonifractor sp. An176]|uniref:hypothetical protein n=1 Tax=Pseudoflavonifractor sp. An176 TaxID=1965572 RepID=UPI00117B7B94|nr:hypothetical protein [Pseudoflavonifractor sp. An176]